MTQTALPPKAPAQVTKAPYTPPNVPQPKIKAGEDRQEDKDDPREIAPVSKEERLAYSLQEQREKLDIELTASQGTQARIVRRPKSANIHLVTSGGNIN
jgi:hypothetical protein